jgi:hypothetical protein
VYEDVGSCIPEVATRSSDLEDGMAPRVPLVRSGRVDGLASPDAGISGPRGCCGGTPGTGRTVWEGWYTDVLRFCAGEGGSGCVDCVGPGREAGVRTGAGLDGGGPTGTARDEARVDACGGAGAWPFAVDDFRISLRVPELSEVIRVRGGPTEGSFDVLEGRNMRENTLPFFRESRDTCEDDIGGADGARGGKFCDEMEGATGDGARIDGSRESAPYGCMTGPRTGVPDAASSTRRERGESEGR